MRKNQNLTPPGQNKMGVMPVGKLLVNMATPMIIAMIVQALYNIVDSFYVAKISEPAVNAMSIAFPIQNLLIGFATGIGVGVNSLLSKSLGEGNQERANRAAGNGFFLVGISFLLFAIFGAFFAKPYFASQSSVQETVEGGAIYIAICCIGSLGVLVEVLGERLLQASGRTAYTMVTQGSGAIINIILDPVFIFGLGPIPAMGIAGAAVATVIGQWVAAILALIFNLKFNHDVQLALRYFKPRRDALSPVLVVGVPAMIMTSIGSIMVLGMNAILRNFPGQGETPVGVFGIYFKLQSFFFMPLFGLNNATISIVAYNYGARKPERIIKTLKIACVSALTFMLAGLVVFQVAPDLLLGLFNPTEQFLEIGRSALRIISLCFPLAAVCIALGASFQALGNGIYSTITSLCRQLVVLLPVAYLLSLTGNVNLVWWSFPVAELASMAATIFFFVRIYRQKIKPML